MNGANRLLTLSAEMPIPCRARQQQGFVPAAAALVPRHLLRSVNLIALLNRFKENRPQRIGSPRKHAAQGRYPPAARGASRSATASMVSSTRLENVDVDDSRSRRPASIFSPDVIDQREQRLAARTTISAYSRCCAPSGVVTATGHADDAIERRAYFMTHVGQNSLWRDCRLGGLLGGTQGLLGLLASAVLKGADDARSGRSPFVVHRWSAPCWRPVRSPNGTTISNGVPVRTRQPRWATMSRIRADRNRARIP